MPAYTVMTENRGFRFFAGSTNSMASQKVARNKVIVLSRAIEILHA
jgi:hypothetical protein